VYVTEFFANTNLVIDGRTNAWDFDTTFSGAFQAVAVNQVDDTVYLIENALGTMSVMNGRDTNDMTSITVAGEYDPLYVAVNQADDTVYVANDSGTVSVINGRTNTWDGTITAAGQYDPRGLAVDQVDDTVYVANNSGTVSVINGRTNTWDDTITVGAGLRGVAVDGSGTHAGLVYVTNSRADSVSVIGRVTPSLGSTTGRAGSTTTVALDVPQVAYDVDDATITSVSFGGRRATGLAADVGDAWNLTVPAGTGTVPVTVTFKGGLKASAGSFTYSPPEPSITITGTRDGQRITVTGTATGLTGKTLRPWIRFSGQSAYSEGTAVITPTANGTFTWSRKTSKRASVYIAHGETNSNTVIIPAR
jgi:DNA-binding beta-propeller fold protein YncE